jgi:DNA-binding NtrC family response regulator
MPMGKILVIDDEEYIGWIIKKTFEATDNEVHLAYNGKQGLEEFNKQSFDIVFLDLRLPDMDGMEILEDLKKLKPSTAVVIVTAHGSIDTAIESMKKGAFDYITKPFDVDELIIQAEKAMELGRLKDEIIYLREEASKDVKDTLFTSSNVKMDSIYKSLERLAASTATVLITGESGTGKEVIARRIHQLSSRKAYPFVVFNCAALEESTMEAELFGTRSGKSGKLELANRGTIFLDEIGEMSLNIQAKLLSFIDGKGSIKSDIRIIAASNKDLREAMKKGQFREELYYRLNVLPIEIPPLRDRKEDISELINLFVKKHDTYGKIQLISPEVMKLLRNYSWPGNIRELENVIERIVILNKDTVIKAESLPLEILDQRKKTREPIIYFPEEGINLEEVEKELIIKALQISGQNQTKASALLGITRSALIYRMQKYNL